MELPLSQGLARSPVDVNVIADFIAGVQRVQRHPVLCFELFGRAAAVRSDGAALRLLDPDGAIDWEKLVSFNSGRSRETVE